MKFDAYRQYLAFLVLGWELVIGTVNGAIRGPLLGKRAAEMFLQKQSDVIADPNWKHIFGLDTDIRDFDFPERVLSQRQENMPSDYYPDNPGYIVIKKLVDTPREIPYIDNLADNELEYPSYNSRSEEPVREVGPANRIRDLFRYFK